MGIKKYFYKNKNKQEKEESVKAQQEKTDSYILSTIAYLQGKRFQVCTSEYDSYIEIEGQQILEKMETLTFLKDDIQVELKVAKKELIGLDKRIKTLRTEERILRDAIISFTDSVSEVSARYKLSPNWEGKKPILIEKRNQLEAAKSAYEKKVQEINEMLEAYRISHSKLFGDIEEACLLYIEERS